MNITRTIKVLTVEITAYDLEAEKVIKETKTLPETRNFERDIKVLEENKKFLSYKITNEEERLYFMSMNDFMKNATYAVKENKLEEINETEQ